MSKITNRSVGEPNVSTSILQEIGYPYAAGLIDGEGCIGMYWNSVHKNYQLRITVEMTEKGGLDVLYNLFGGRWYYKSPNQSQNLQGRYSWMVFNAEAEKALQSLLPYLIVKKKHAAIALEARWSGNVRFQRLSRQEINKRESVAKRIKNLNKRGYGSH